MRFRIPLARAAGAVRVDTVLFPYDLTHQTFLNVYEGDVLMQQSIFDVAHTGADYYAGTRRGALAVIQRFVPSGIRHIMIGPDHILFLVGLLLLGGSAPPIAADRDGVHRRTQRHPVARSLDILNPPAAAD